MRSFGPDCARGLDVRTQKSSSPVASVSGATGTSKEAGPSEPRQCGDRGARSRALTTLVEAVHNATADVGSIPTVSIALRKSRSVERLFLFVNMCWLVDFPGGSRRGG